MKLTRDFHSLSRIETIEGIKRGLESMKRQRGKPATEFFREFFTDNGISEARDD